MYVNSVKSQNKKTNKIRRAYHIRDYKLGLVVGGCGGGSVAQPLSAMTPVVLPLVGFR